VKVCESIFERIVSPENLFAAWDEFSKGKQARGDVRTFAWRLEQNIFALHRALVSGAYRHGPYSAFTICDPKQRRIHKAMVRDRIVHHAVFAVLNPLFEPSFIAQSFSCRVGKGTHRAVDALERMLRKVSRNGTGPCFALKCDVLQFFASVDHAVLLEILRRRISDERAVALLTEIVDSFAGEHQTKGVPIGNLTSQLFANIYLNEFDQFMKHELKIKPFIRYTDDFVVVSESEEFLRCLVQPVENFLRERLRLTLHPHKVTIRKYRQGIDFLGYVLLPHCRVVRTKTKRRMLRKLKSRVVECLAGARPWESVEASLQSYLGVLSHASTYRLTQYFVNQYWFWLTRWP